MMASFHLTAFLENSVYLTTLGTVRIGQKSANCCRSENFCKADAQQDGNCMNGISTMASCPVSIPCPHAA
jgi:hypothetical protein